MENTTDIVVKDNSVQKMKIRSMVANIYDVQKLRISCGNRLVASFKGLAEASRSRTAESVKAEIEAKADDEKKIRDKILKKNKNLSEAELSELVAAEIKKAEDKDANNYINKIMGEYTRITDEIVVTIRNNPRASQIEKAIMEANAKDTPLELIGDVYDYRMAEQYANLLKLEQEANDALFAEVKKHPLWDAFFNDIKGCGPLMAAVCISYFDVYNARHPSSFWKYAGLDTVFNEETGLDEGRSRKHREEQTYVDSEGNIKTKVGLGYNPILKAKLCGVLGGCILKANVRTDKNSGTKSTTGYAKAYYDYKRRLDNREDTKNFSDLHKHRMANRYMVKQFIRDLWCVWRTLEGLEVTEPYEVAYLGRKHHGYNDAVDKFLESHKNKQT